MVEKCVNFAITNGLSEKYPRKYWLTDRSPNRMWIFRRSENFGLRFIPLFQPSDRRIVIAISDFVADANAHDRTIVPVQRNQRRRNEETPTRRRDSAGRRVRWGGGGWLVTSADMRESCPPGPGGKYWCAGGLTSSRDESPAAGLCLLHENIGSLANSHQPLGLTRDLAGVRVGD